MCRRDRWRSAGSLVSCLAGLAGDDGPGSQLSLVEEEALVEVHAGALVEPRSAGRALRVDTEADVRHTALVERGERMVEHREGEPASTPRPPHTDDLDPALSIDIVREDGACNLVVV